MDSAPVNLASDDVWHAAVLQQLRKKFTSLMRRLHIASQGAQLAISLLEEPEAPDFITTHASILDSSFAQTSMSEAMRTSLQKSDYIFSGIKTFHELNEAFPSLLDENGNRKPFEQFLNDVQKIDEKYNINYLRAEYNFCQQSANMAAKWEQFQADGDRYNLQYRTAGDDHVRPAHAALDRITLPPSHPFWEKYFPPNGWNCRCTVVQVRKSKYPQTPDSEVEHLIEATVPDGSPSGKEDMFRFNPGIEKKTVPDYNPYTIRRCQDCDIAKGKVNLAYVPENELCNACKLLHQCEAQRFNVINEFENGGKVSVHQLVNTKDSDYDKLMEIATYFAKTFGEDVKLTPKISRPPQFVYQNIYHTLMGTAYEGKCPDLLVGTKWYEHEGYTTSNPKKAFKNMLNHGLKQSDRLIIDLPNLTDAYMKRIIRNRITDGQAIREVWVKNGPEIRLLYKKFEE